MEHKRMPYVNYFSTTAPIRHTRGIRVAALVAERVEIVDLGGWSLEHDAALDMIISIITLDHKYTYIIVVQFRGHEKKEGLEKKYSKIALSSIRYSADVFSVETCNLNFVWTIRSCC